MPFTPAGIYLHIPFCKQACYYCNFHFSTSTRYKIPLLAALKQELTLRKNYLDNPIIETIYLGGGTPSLLTPQEIANLLNHITHLFPIAKDPEITLEANPDNLTFDYLTELKQVGINRLSIGVQSFSDTVLTSLNRTHTGVE